MKSSYFKELVNVFSSITSRKEMEDFLYGILTPQELEEIPVRLQIVKLLKKGIPQHEIAQKLGVGVATVTRGSKEIAKGRFSSITEKGWRPPKSGG
ncbi:MAG: Trp family transcriptional regulator [Patescibacteria group bacterium]